MVLTGSVNLHPRFTHGFFGAIENFNKFDDVMTVLTSTEQTKISFFACVVKCLIIVKYLRRQMDHCPIISLKSYRVQWSYTGSSTYSGRGKLYKIMPSVRTQQKHEHLW